MKRKILFCSEATFLNTGYAIYTREVLNYLHNTGKYEIAELASYGEKNDPRGMSSPWKYYGVAPNTSVEPKTSKEEFDAYNSNPSNQFGAWAFEAVCLDFMPDIVCVPPETLIHTENGYKQIKEIKVGQKVMSHKGIYQSVTKTMRRQHVGDIIKIKAGGDSQYMQLTEEHPVYAYRKKRQTNQKKSYKDIYDGMCPEFIPAKDIKVGDLVILPKNNSANISSEIDITNYLSNFIIKNDKIYPTKITNCNPINKNCLLNYELGVLIGYIIGDGSINQGSVCVTFNAHEINFAEDCAKLFCNIFGIPASLNLIEAKNCINVTCNSVLLSEFLEKFIGKKEDKHICAELFNSSISTKQGLLRGLFRSDGCYRPNTVSFTSKMQHLAYEVRQICVDLNIPVSINKSSKAYSVEGYGESARLLHEIVQKFDINKLELCENPTRRPRTTHIINGHMVAAVQRVRKENYTGQVYNLEVDVDNSYVTNWCVHNCDIRDFWMMSHEETSPFRPYYHLVWMPTVDAYPQSRQWIASYAQCDACFTYSNWAGKILTEQSGGKIKWRGSAPPCASKEFQPIWDKDAHKQSHGIDPNFKIIGTVMRNQRRKLYPDLFEAFRKFLDQSIDKRFYLYCHTSYPDLGWDIPELLQENDLSSHVLFTYICHETGKFFPSFFRGPVAQSPFTGRWGSTLSNVKRGLNNVDLAQVYNLFDLYVQYANCLHKDQEIKIKRDNKEIWCKISEVKIGDLAWTHKNRWKKITHTWINLEKSKHSKMLEAQICGDYETLRVTQDHEMPAYTKNEFQNKRSVREQIGNSFRNGKDLPEMGKYRADQLQSGDIISYPIDDIIYDINKINILSDKKDLQLIVDHAFCKWLGLYVADGSANLNASCGAIKITSHVKENECHELCENVMSRFSEGGVKTYFYKDRQALNKEIFNKPFVEYMKNHCGKLENKRFPEWVMNLPPDKQKECLQGLFMGDGHSCTRRESTISIFCTISKTLANQLKQILRRLRISFNVRLVVKKQEADGYNRKPQYRFEIYGDIKNGEFYTNRHNTKNFYHGNQHYLQIKTINEIKYNDNVYCVTVDEDHTMLTPAGLVYQCEGFGIPMVEAASCGIPIMGTDYSAMESVVRELGGYTIKPKALYKELETGCMRAVPDNDLACEMFKQFFTLSKEQRLEVAKNTKRLCEQDFNIEKTGSQWERCFDELPQKPFEQTWGSPPRIKTPASKIDATKDADFHKLAKWLITNVLCEPERLNSFMESRLARDLMYKSTTANVGGLYFNESSAVFDGLNFRQDFSFDVAYDQMRQLCDRRNQWEQARINRIRSMTK